MKSRINGKEIIKAAAVCVLSIGLFSGAFIGFNRLTFAAATNEATPLPPVMSDVSIQNAAQNDAPLSEQLQTEAKIFTAPTLTLIASPYQHTHPIPASAMSMEDAAQAGARYIWDVLGESIDGMHVQMLFSAHAGQITTWWVGTVYVEDPANPTQNYIESAVFPGQRHAVPVYMFVVNGITGERIDISYMGRVGSRRTLIDNEAEVRDTVRGPLAEIGWFNMSIYEQLDFAGITFESYKAIATRLAQAKFNRSHVVDVQLLGLSATSMVDGVLQISSLNFTATDNNGREAFISVPASDSLFRYVRISTQHNDFIPGFDFNNIGHGLG